MKGDKDMKISDKGIALIKKCEGCKLTAYKDSTGVWTIGYGMTNACKSITGLTIKAGVKITQAQADEMLVKVLNQKYVPLVNKYDSKYHFNQNQLDALVSFAYNIGSIDKLTNNGKRTIAEISKKIPEYNKAGGKVLAGLTARRKAEKALFDTPIVVESKTTATPTATRKYLYGGVDYSPVFDPVYYAEHHKDVVAVYGTNPTKLFNHFTVYGMKEGRQANAVFNVKKYKANNIDLQRAYGTNLKLYYYHFIVYGRNEASRKGTY